MNHDGWMHELCAECFHAFGSDEATEELAAGVCCSCGHPRDVAAHRLAPTQCRRRVVMPAAPAESLPDVEPVPVAPAAAPSFEFVGGGAPEDLGATKGSGD